MRNILLILFLSFTGVPSAALFGDVAIIQNGKFTQLLPEITGFERENGYFGSSVAVDGDHMVVNAAPSVFSKGAVAIYKKSQGQWVLVQIMTANEQNGLVNFAETFDISGNRLVISSEEENSASTLIYELINGNWQLSQSISIPKSNGLKGSVQNVVVEENMLVVAVDFGLNQSSLLHVYRLNNDTWQLSKTIDDIDLDNQVGNSRFHVDFDEHHMVVSRSDGFYYSLVRLYDLADASWETFQVLDSSEAIENYGGIVSLDAERLVISDPSFNVFKGVVFYYEKNNGQWQLEQTILGPEHGQNQDKQFGSSVQLDGDRLLVGSNSDDEIAGGAGAVFYYQYLNGQWVEQQKLMASDGALDDSLGTQVKLLDSEVIFSATRADTEFNNAGKVYSFTLNNNTWSESQIIAPSASEQDKIFGNALAMNGQWVVVGADGDSDVGEVAGAVYLYKKSNGTLNFIEKVYADQPGKDQRFGKNIVIENDVMLIAASGNTVVDGYVHYYKLISGQWLYQSKFKPTDSLPTDRFGYALSLEAGVLAVSAMYQASESGTENANTGAVYIFEKQGDTWIEQHKLLPTSEIQINTFGFNVSLEGERLAVSTVASGRVFVFQKINESWEQTHELSQPDSALGFAFGRSVNLINDQLIVSQPLQSPLIYKFNGSELSESTALDSALNSSDDITRDIHVKGTWLVMTRDSTLGETNALVYQLIEGSWQFVHSLNKPINRTRYWNDINIYENEVLIGDLNNSQRGNSSGAAYWIQDLADANFRINQGLNGNWYNTETSGQGLFLDVVPSRDYSFMGLFTYDTISSNDDAAGQIGAEGHRWLVGQGVIDQTNLSINYQLYYAYDGLFDNSRATTTFNAEPYGSMEIKFQSCSAAEVSYEIFGTGLNNSYPIQRQVASSGELCDYFADDMNDVDLLPTFDYRLNGAWYNPETSGQGLFIDKFKGIDAAFMGWFTYDTTLPQGADSSQIGAQGQRWLVGQGEVAQNNPNIIDYQLYYTSGGLFDDPIDPMIQGADGYGSLRVEFIDCGNANVTYEIESEGLSGSYSMVRVAPDPEVCDLSGE